MNKQSNIEALMALQAELEEAEREAEMIEERESPLSIYSTSALKAELRRRKRWK